MAKGKRRTGKTAASKAGSPIKTPVKTKHLSTPEVSALRASRDFRLQLFDELPSPIWAAGTDAKCNYFNKSWLTFTGRSAEQELGDGWSEGVHPDDRSRCFDMYLQAFQARAPFELEYRLRRHDGEYRWILDTGRPLYARSGSFAGYIGSCLDITERKQVDAALRESEERFRTLYDDNPSMCFTVDADGTVRSVNRFGTEQLGYHVDELVGHSVLAVFHEEDRQKAVECLRAAFQAPAQVHQWELRKVRKDGCVLWVREDVRIIQDSAGKPLALVVCEDITEHKRAEEELRSSEKRYRMLVEISPSAIFVNVEDRIVFVNDAFVRLMGASSPDQIIGRSPFEFIHPHSHAVVRKRIRLLRNEKTSVPLIDEQYVRLDGTVVEVEVVATPFAFHGQDAIMVLLNDITTRRQAEAALRMQGHVLECMLEGVSLSDENGVILYTNPAEDVMFGYEPGGLIGKHVTVLNAYPPEENARIVEGIIGQLKTKGTWEGEFSNRKKDGTPFTTAARITALELSGKRHWVCVQEDITERKLAADAMRESEERFRQLAEHVREVFWMTDPEKNLMLYISPAYQEIWGRTCESLYASPRAWLDAIHADDRDRVLKAALTKQMQGTYDEEYRIIRPDGSQCWIHDRAFPVREPSGLVYRIVGIAEDITERKRAQEALRASEERFDLAVRGSQEGLWDGHVLPGEPWHSPRTPVWWSQRIREMLGFTEEEFPNVLESWAKLLHPDDKERVFESMVAHIERKVPYEAEYRLKTRGGAYRWFRAHGQALWDAGGNIVRMAGNMQDITEHKRTDEALRRAEEQYRSIFENAVEGIFQTTADGRYLNVNPALAHIYGYESPDEMMEAVTDIKRQVYVEPDRRDEFRRLLETQDAVTGLEAQVYRKDGSVIWISESARAVRDQQGALLCYEGTVEDITERKRLEQQLLQSQKMEAIGRLAGGVAHDFNNLLTAIMGYSELLLGSVGSEEARRRNTEQIKKAAQRAAALTRQLLAFSRRQVLTMRVLELNDIVAAMEPMLHRLIGEDITLVTVLDRALERTKADVGQIEQVIMNLVVNASDAMPHGGTLTVETANVVLDQVYVDRHGLIPPGAYVRLTVSDTGLGMDAETQAHIFEPFFTTKEQGRGTGLGLSTVYGVIKQSGGYIWVYSEPGRGTMFKIYLPRVDEAVETIERSIVSVESSHGTETILLVEDDVAVRAVAEEVLRTNGYTVLTARNSDEAFRLHGGCEGLIHLLVTDVVMPGMGGRELAERLKSSRPTMQVLFMSGYTDDAVVRHGVLEEEVAYLQKPFTPDVLTRKVREVLDESSRETKDG